MSSHEQVMKIFDNNSVIGSLQEAPHIISSILRWCVEKTEGADENLKMFLNGEFKTTFGEWLSALDSLKNQSENLVIRFPDDTRLRMAVEELASLSSQLQDAEDRRSAIEVKIEEKKQLEASLEAVKILDDLPEESLIDLRNRLDQVLTEKPLVGEVYKNKEELLKWSSELQTVLPKVLGVLDQKHEATAKDLQDKTSHLNQLNVSNAKQEEELEHINKAVEESKAQAQKFKIQADELKRHLEENKIILDAIAKGDVESTNLVEEIETKLSKFDGVLKQKLEKREQTNSGGKR